MELGQRISLGNHFAPPNLVGDRSNPPSNKVIPVVSTKVQDSGEPSSALFAPEQVATSATFSSILHCQLATQIDQVQPCEPPTMLMGSNHLQTSLFPSFKIFHLRLSGRLFSHRNLDRTQPHPACPSAPCNTSTRFSPKTTPHPTLPPQRAEGLNHHTKPGDRLDQPCIGLG